MEQLAKINHIYCCDVIDGLRQIPNESIDCVITSPPYWGLRDYGVDGQIGLEPTLEEYLEKLLKITAELKRVLKKTGTMWWNQGDCYGGSGCGKGDYRNNNMRSLSVPKLYCEKPNLQLQLTSKCLALQNWRLILRMIDEQGWILRNTIIWHKPNHMPSSVKDRFTNSYEPVFMLVKNKKYYFDLDAVRVPHKVCGVTDKRPMGVLRQLAQYQYKKQTHYPQDQAESFGSPRARYWRKGRGSNNPALNNRNFIPIKRNIDPRGNDEGGPGSWRVFKEDNPSFTNPKGKNPGDLWRIPTQPAPPEIRGKFFAIFPEKLIEPMVKAGCPEFICKKCGKPREPIMKSNAEKREIEWHNEKYGEGDERGKRLGRMQPQKSVYNTSIKIGLTDCGCNAGFESGIVLDPFIGSGTTALVALKNNRKFIGIELNPKYVEMANKRIKPYLEQQKLF